MFTLENLDSKKNPVVQPSEPLKWQFNGFADQCEIELAPYQGTDFSKIAFLFCGQGTMSKGAMADFVKSGPVFQLRFKELDQISELLGIGKASDYILNPDKVSSKPIESMYSALCLFTLQVSMFETLLAVGFYPQSLSAHSFGEFAQITASGVVSFKDMIRFLVERQKSLNAIDGKYVMFAVNNSAKLDLNSIPFPVHVANVNTNYQTSFVCQEKDYPEIRQILKTQRIASVPVNVDFPYHTPWLESVHIRLKEILTELNLDMKPPKIPFVSSVTQEMISEDGFSKEKIQTLLTDQVVRSVHFPKQLKRLQQTGTMHFFELGPQDVLGSFIEQVFESEDATVKINSFRNYFKSGVTSKKTYEKLKSSKFFNALDGALKALTGYSIEHIQLEDRIREDLGIDSIKKAEIVFEIIDTLNQHQIVTPTNLSDLSTFGDILEYFETSRLAAEKADNSAEKERVTAFEARTRSWVPARLTDLTSLRPPNVVRINLSELRSGQVVLKTEKTDLLVLTADDKFGLGQEFLSEAQWWLAFFKEKEILSKRWVFLHQDSRLAQAMDAFFTSFAQELQVSYKSIATDNLAFTDADLYQESADFAQAKVRYQSGQRQIRIYGPVQSPNMNMNPKRVLAFGGMGGIGHHLLQSFADGALEVLTIVGRKSSQDVQDQLSALKSKAKTVEYYSANVEDENEIAVLVTDLLKKHQSFDLALHSVGVETSELLQKSTPTELAKIMKGKVTLTGFLTKMAGDHPEMKVILNSSIVSEFGSRGQTAYAMANAYMNHLADHSKNILSILWPGWDQTGVAAQSMNAKSLKLQGMSLMAAERGQAIFHQLMAAQGSVCVLDQNAILDYAAIGQARHEFGQLMKPASRNYSLFVIPGLTQSHLPYLKDHLIKKMCIFPASGSLSLMLFRAYLERGEIGHIENFQAHNFLVVGQDTSGVTLEAVKSTPERLSFQMKSHQLLNQGEVVFKDVADLPSVPPFKSNLIGVTDFDNNAAVYTGPNFELMKKSYGNTDNDKLLVQIDLPETPKYFDIPFIDKIHKLIEISFSAPFAKVVISHMKFTLPKSVQSITFHKAGMRGLKFSAIVDNLRQEGGFFRCDVTTVNEQGVPAMVFKDYRSLIVGDSKTPKTDGFRATHTETIFDWSAH